ncbi:MAG: hypothetical protein EOP10_31275, partial [Proteobacteria bacterium]
MQHHDTIEQQGDLRSFIVLFRYGRGTYRLMASSIGLVLLSSFFLMFSARTMGSLAEELAGARALNRVLEFVALILFLEGANVAVNYQGRVGLAKVTNRVALAIRKALFHKLSVLP